MLKINTSASVTFQAKKDTINIVKKQNLQILNKSTSPLMDYFDKRAWDVQINNQRLLAEKIKTKFADFCTVLVPVLLTFFSKNRKEQLDYNAENNTAILKDDGANEHKYQNGKWETDEPEKVFKSLINIYDARYFGCYEKVKDIHFRAGIIQEFSKYYVEKLIREKDKSKAKTIDNINNLLDSITKMYDDDDYKIKNHAYNFLDSLKPVGSGYETTRSSVTLKSYMDYQIGLQNNGDYMMDADEGSEHYRFRTSRSANASAQLELYTKSDTPKYYFEARVGNETIETLYDAEGNEYCKETLYNEKNVSVNIKGFGYIQRNYSFSTRIPTTITIKREGSEEKEVYLIDKFKGTITQVKNDKKIQIKK